MKDLVLHISISEGNYPHLVELLKKIVDDDDDLAISSLGSSKPEFFVSLDAFEEDR